MVDDHFSKAKDFLGLAGQNSWEEAQVNELYDQWNDFLMEVTPYAAVRRGFQEGDKERLKKEVFLPAVKRHFPYFVEVLKKNDTGYFVGNRLSHLDLRVADFVNHLDSKSKKLINHYPELRKHKEKVHSIPELKAWLEIRPVTLF